MDTEAHIKSPSLCYLFGSGGFAADGDKPSPEPAQAELQLIRQNIGVPRRIRFAWREKDVVIDWRKGATIPTDFEPDITLVIRQRFTNPQRESQWPRWREFDY
jgi:hypothetical protein